MPLTQPAATITLGGERCPIHPAPILPDWHEIAARKGFEIVARIRDRYHLALRHEACGGMMAAKLFTLRDATPTCPHCQDLQRRDLCRAAGVTWLGRGRNPHYLRIRLACGHETERQAEMLNRVRAGRTAIRCDDCLQARLWAEAAARDWVLTGDDPDGHRNFRLYRHSCGHLQRVAIANMRSGRFTCGGCSDGWTRDPSQLYSMRFVLRDGREAIKVGFSRDPESRLRHQLITRRDQPALVIRTVQLVSGREAIRLEKALHRRLRALRPEAVLDRQIFAGQINCVSELYDVAIEPLIMHHLDRIEARTRRRYPDRRQCRRRR